MKPEKPIYLLDSGAKSTRPLPRITIERTASGAITYTVQAYHREIARARAAAQDEFRALAQWARALRRREVEEAATPPPTRGETADDSPTGERTRQASPRRGRAATKQEATRESD